MRLMVSLDDPNEKETPIKMADAIIDRYMNKSGLTTGDDLRNSLNALDEIADHIKVHVSHWPMEV